MRTYLFDYSFVPTSIIETTNIDLVNLIDYFIYHDKQVYKSPLLPAQERVCHAIQVPTSLLLAL